MNSFLKICCCLPDKTDFETQRRLNRVEVNAAQPVLMHSIALSPLHHSHAYFIYHYHLLLMENKPPPQRLVNTFIYLYFGIAIFLV